MIINMSILKCCGLFLLFVCEMCMFGMLEIGMIMYYESIILLLMLLLLFIT